MAYKNKKAAIELSIGTVVIIVLAMSMLILGLVLIRNIFTGSIESVNTLTQGVQAEITGIFAEEGTKIGIKLGSDKVAKIKQGTPDFGIGFGAQTRNGEAVSLGAGQAPNLKYSLELTNVGNNCPNFETYIRNNPFTGTSPPKTRLLDFDKSEGPNAFSILLFNIPEGTTDCTQRIKIRTYDSSQQEIASDSFNIQITSGGIFG